MNSIPHGLPLGVEERVAKAHYSPPWANTSIIGIAGSSGSGKTSLSHAIIRELNLPWVVILSMDSFYKPLTAEQSAAAFRNEYDFDAPHAMDFDILVEKLRDIKSGQKADIPIYSFAKHARQEKTTTIYSPHVLILEGIFALHDERVLDLLDVKIFAEADADLCLSRRLLRDTRERGRDIEGCIKQWFTFVKPNFHKYVEPQRNVADIIVPRGVENRVAIGMVSDRIHKTLDQKSRLHQLELKRLGKVSEDAPLSNHVQILQHTNQVRGINTILMNPELSREDFIFYFDRLAVMLVEKATETGLHFKAVTVETPVPGRRYRGLRPDGEASAVVILRGGSCLETGLKRVIPDCRTGRVLIQTNFRRGEPELHFYSLAPDISEHGCVLLLDPQMSSGGAALMAVRVLLDHGVREDRIVFVTYMAGKMGLNRLMGVFPEIKVVLSIADTISKMKKTKCSSCDRSLPTTQFPKHPEGSSCEHGRETCRRCWHQWLEAQVNSKSFDQISCAQCSNTLGQGEIRALATPAVYQRYLDSEFKATMSADPDFRWCIAPSCTSGQIHSEGDIFRCVACRHKACSQCNAAWHEGEGCGAYMARVKAQPEEEEASAKALKKMAKLCPGCSRKIEKNGGCDHITCKVCRHEWCWRCLADYNGPAGIRKVGNSAHKGSCEYWRHNPSPDV
ncbi:hypothetical protein LTR36_009166 [Oleoguttula mirabilis]|uniref:Uridine kinase n=1 Tax=Oleoguttula mirabilis TaxID=1507867 RepID=A0AAV9J6M1_9PEZI|nr:hypothetical protein LTR36_009166 [Oleoguttula mirabilis]